jgi:general secretion pathway protein I
MATSASVADPARRGGEAGFTLIEMLVALAIFSLAALALLRARLSEQALAQIVVRNLAVETLTDPVPPAFGSDSGVVLNAGRQWRWSRSTQRSPESRIQLITLQVQSLSGPGRASLTVFRRAAP